MEQEGKPLYILSIAVLAILLLSFVGWESLSGGKLKSYDLFNDVRTTPRLQQKGGGNEYLDPDLAMLDEDKYEFIPEEEIIAMPANEEDPTDDITEEEKDVDPHDADLIATEIEGTAGGMEEESFSDTSVESVSETSEPIKTETKKVTPSGGKTFEDYSPDNQNITNLRNALDQTLNRTVRIAVLGDSYIEGDIFTEAIRSTLQTKYGGKGVGYTPVYSPISGFRQSVNHSCSGFKQLDFRKNGDKNFIMLQGVASKAEEGAAATFTGSKVPNAESWSRSRILLTAPEGGELKLRSGKDNQAEWSTYKFHASDSIQAIDLTEETSRLSIGGITQGIIFHGAYLDGTHGIAIDNMSIRGYSGIRHNEISASITAQSRSQIDYDLIVLEYGINGLSSEQTNYSAYGKRMIQVVNYIKQLYPNAVILIMGIGDRGDKIDGEYHSMATVPNMIAEQRKVAKETGSLFWDTRGAMGGEDAVVAWVKNKEVNSDYIHLTLKGGKRLGKLFTQALENTLVK